MALTAKMQKFVASYQLTSNSTQSAINAGYSVKTAPQAGCRMLKNPKIVNELEQWRVKKSKEYSKDDLIDKCMNDYEAVDVKEANRPRFIELTAKLLNYIGSNQDSRPNQSLTVNVSLTGKETEQELLGMIRKLLTGNDLGISTNDR